MSLLEVIPFPSVLRKTFCRNVTDTTLILVIIFTISSRSVITRISSLGSVPLKTMSVRIKLPVRKFNDKEVGFLVSVTILRFQTLLAEILVLPVVPKPSCLLRTLIPEPVTRTFRIRTTTTRILHALLNVRDTLQMIIKIPRTFIFRGDTI